MFARRDLADGRLQVAQQFGRAGVVVAVEGRQLVEDVVTALDGRVAEHPAAGDHLEGDAAETLADADVDVPGVLALSRPLPGPVLEVMVALDQVVGDAEDGGEGGSAARGS